MATILAVGTDIGYFVYFNTATGKELGSGRGKGWPSNSNVAFLRSINSSIRCIGGMLSGEVFLLDIN